MIRSETANPVNESIIAPLRHALFRRIWIASLMSNLGLLIMGTARLFVPYEVAHPFWLIAIPGGALAVLILAINLAGDGLHDFLAPQGKS